MNKVILMGRLTADPEIRQGSITIGTFNLAVDRKYKKDGEKNTDFFKCVSFGKQADFVNKYLHQGIKILITGRVEQDNYTKAKEDFDVVIAKTELKYIVSR